MYVLYEVALQLDKLYITGHSCLLAVLAPQMLYILLVRTVFDLKNPYRNDSHVRIRPDTEYCHV